MGLLNNIFKKKDKKTNFQDEMNMIIAKTRAAMMSPSFRGLYDFQQDFLPKKFYQLGSNLISVLKENRFYELVEEFKLSGSVLLLNPKNSSVKLSEYDNKIIIHLNIPDLSKLKMVKRESPLCNSIYLCIDLLDSNKNYYYTAERSEDNHDFNYILCGRCRLNNHYNFGNVSKSGLNFIKDIPLEEIELIFGVKQTSNESINQDKQSKISHLKNFDLFFNSLKIIVSKLEYDQLLFLTFSLVLFEHLYFEYQPELSPTMRLEILKELYIDFTNKENKNRFLELRNEFNLAIENPQAYYIGQTFGAIPNLQDIKLTEQMMNTIPGIICMVFIDFVFFEINEINMLKNPLIISIVTYMEHVPKFIEVRADFYGFLNG